nr:MAG TPA: Terminase small subunit [Caudoviricetes sp.]
MYKQGLKLIEIANQLGIAEGTVRSWKNRYKWDAGGNATLQKKEKKERNVAKKIATQNNDASWVEIEHEYVTDISRKPCSLEDLADKYDIPIKTLKDRCAKDGWVRKRTEYVLDTCQKAKEKSSDADADRIVRLLSIADKAAEKVEQALGELEQYVVRDKKKVKTVEYKDDTAIGKPTKEIIDETEHINIASGPIDRLGLSQVTGALKNLKDIYMIPNALDAQKHSQEMDKRKLEVDLLKLEMQTKESADDTPEQDNFLDALNTSAQEVWSDE